MNYLYPCAAIILTGFCACMCAAFIMLAVYAIDGWAYFRWAALWFALAMFALPMVYHALTRMSK